jgi:hypothetical protein
MTADTKHDLFSVALTLSALQVYLWRTRRGAFHTLLWRK